MTKSIMPSVLVVEDDMGIQELLRFTLEQAGYETHCADSAETAQGELKNLLPDLVIVDWMLPAMSGLQLARQLRSEARTRHLPIIMVTARGEEPDRVAGLEEGADDYIVKPFSPKELVARVHAVLRRRAPELSNNALVNGPIRLDTTSYEAFVDGKRMTLTPIEFKLLRFLMANPGRVYSRNQLLDQVWGDHVYVEERTVDVHIRRLRMALGDAGEALIETVRGAGYKMLSQPAAGSAGSSSGANPSAR
jgi:two-component system, OmpR family, phosphate regulon response regulator PhoB